MMLANNKIADGDLLPPSAECPIPGCDRYFLRVSVWKRPKIQRRGRSGVQKEGIFHCLNADLYHGQAIAGGERNIFSETLSERPSQKKHEDEAVTHWRT